MKEGKSWLLAAWSSMLISLVAMAFTPVAVYVSGEGETLSYSILSLVTDGSHFSQSVLNEYTGPVLLTFRGPVVAALAAVAIAAVACALVGLVLIGTQYPQRWQFCLTFVGLVGTAVPSVLILVGVFLSEDYFLGTLRCGASPVITPVAMIISIIAVTKRRSAAQKAVTDQLIAEGKLMRGGDL